ncbi:MAG: His/Gly/Thr/Pro-type tRNA ligase C-terminal domain-containing protein, partial [Actinomycetia bacterium]|nr:His/Gly/Thr/Pro-type tRNA ligase C-terminal domain-containing protein [Actinomycetes bacterium]
EAAGITLDIDQGCDLFIASATDELRVKAFDLAARLRDEGWYVQSDLAHRSLKAQMKAADKAGASMVAILGPDEDARNGFVIRDMNSKEEEFMTYEALLTLFEYE